MNKIDLPLTICFMGVDGSGKSTLIKEIKKKFKIKYLHLRPYFFLTDKRITVKNPHKLKKTQVSIVSLFRLLIWLFIYNFFFYLNNNNKKKLIIFDRYAHDILIDPIRYNFNLSKKITKKILNYFPEPDLWIILNAGSYTAYNRKKEISLKETVRQSREYLKFAKNRKNSIVINTSKNLKKSVTILTKTIISQHGKN